LEERIRNIKLIWDICVKIKSKAMCLSCWSDRTAFVSFDNSDKIVYDFVHECDGNLKIVKNPDFDPDSRTLFYSPKKNDIYFE